MSGMLTAEQVMAIAGKHQPDYCSDTHVCFDWQSIADELYAYVNTIHVDGPRIDVDIYEEDGRHIRAHVPIRNCPMCGRELRGDA